MHDRDPKIDAAIRELDLPEVRDIDFEILFEDSPTGIAMVHADGYFLKVNQSFCDIVGYSPAELVRRRRYQDITHPDDVDADSEESQRVRDGESDAYRLLKRFLHKRGQSVWVQLQVTPARSAAGVFVHFVAHISHMPMSDEFYRVEETADGGAAIRPFYPLAKLLRDNWKAVSAAAVTVAGSIGTLGVNYLTMRTETTQQKEIISYQQKEIDRQKVELESIRKQLERLDRK